MSQSVRNLDSHQRLAFDIIIEYIKTLRASEHSSMAKPEPPFLIIHGGAGSGKSKLIDDIATWVDWWMRYNNNNITDPDKPTVIKLAPTGKAAGVINGLTLHSGLNFDFGNEYKALPDKIRESKKETLSNLTVLIIDEMSMVKSDQLYKLYLRLQEIKQSKQDFGGVAIILCGDLMQLKPVIGNWIFDAPKNPQFDWTYRARPLWNLFQVIELKNNHRQGSDKTYGDMLNRLRFLKKDEEMRDEDRRLLEARVTKEWPEGALFAYGKNAPVIKQNKEELEKLEGQLETFKASNIHPHQKNFKPNVNKDGFINDTPFLSELQLKVGSRVMLTFNKWNNWCCGWF